MVWVESKAQPAESVAIGARVGAKFTTDNVEKNPTNKIAIEKKSVAYSLSRSWSSIYFISIRLQNLLRSDLNFGSVLVGRAYFLIGRRRLLI